MELVSKINKERIDKYLANETEYSRATIAKMIENDYILVNDNKIKNNYQVKEGDIINIDESFKEEINLLPQEMDLDIVFEDEYLLVVNKQSGVVVHPGSGNYNNTLVNGLLYHTNLSTNDEERPGIVHRIDKDTSGLLIVAKNNEVHNLLTECFKNKTIKRKYIALLTGVFPHNSATIDAPIGRDPLNRKKMAVTEYNSKSAVTHLKVLERYKAYTLASMVLETGRTHQIRVHTNYIGYPIYNDPVYTNKKCSQFGQFLHSSEMELIHPITKKEMKFTADLPVYFQNFLNELE